MTRSIAQQTQLIEFFQQWLPHVEAFGYLNLPAGTHGYYREGKKLFKAQQESERAAAIAKSRATRWTAEEYDAMAAAYIQFGRDRKACLTEFRKFSDRHTDDAVTFAAYSAAALDTTEPASEGFKDFAHGLLDALNAIEPGRFKATR